METLKASPLGQKTSYIETYSPDLLFPISRKLARDKIGWKQNLPFSGVDLWTGFEISWLNSKGKPEVAAADFSFPCESPSVIESKSFKLYLNSFNQSVFNSFHEVQETMRRDLSSASGTTIDVNLFPVKWLVSRPLEEFSGICLDTLDVETKTYQVDKSFLATETGFVKESIYSDLLKSNCLATGQPDWGSVFIKYAGPKIDHNGLLKYFISFRNHSGFAEHCVEQIYYDVLHQCQPNQLTVYARYTRRGGLDINPFRSNFELPPRNTRQFRQ